MLRLALKMMVGDRAKFIGILIGLTFAAFIIIQQAGIFVGVLERTFGFIADTSQADIWVMNEKVQYLDDIKTLKDAELNHVRGIEGVAWAAPLYKGLLTVRLKDGSFQICHVIGVDSATLIGGPPVMVEGSLLDLRAPQAVLINDIGAKDKLATLSKEGRVIPMRVGDHLQINDRKVTVRGICKVHRTFQSQPVIYTTYQRALLLTPDEQSRLTFILVKAKEGMDLNLLCDKIRANTQLAAYTAEEFKKLTVNYYLKYTGIPVNFGFAVLLGFIIGIAITGQTFYNFAHDNLRYFGIFKAMGATNTTLAKMVMFQGVVMASLGWGLGMGLASLFGLLLGHTELSFALPFWLFIGSGISLLIITLSAALISLLAILRLEPAIVFQTAL